MMEGRVQTWHLETTLAPACAVVRGLMKRCASAMRLLYHLPLLIAWAARRRCHWYQAASLLFSWLGMHQRPSHAVALSAAETHHLLSRAAVAALEATHHRQNRAAGRAAAAVRRHRSQAAAALAQRHHPESRGAVVVARHRRLSRGAASCAPCPALLPPSLRHSSHHRNLAWPVHRHTQIRELEHTLSSHALNNRCSGLCTGVAPPNHGCGLSHPPAPADAWRFPPLPRWR